MSARKSISFDDMVRLPRTMSKNLAKEMERATKQIAKVLLATANQQTASAGIKDTGLYAKSWKVVEFGRSAQLVNTAPYAGVIEVGAVYRGKGPPVSKIIPWVRRKLPGVLPQERKRVAFAVARKIKRTGLPGYLILQNTLEAAQPQIDAILQAAVAKGVK